MGNFLFTADRILSTKLEKDFPIRQIVTPFFLSHLIQASKKVMTSLSAWLRDEKLSTLEQMDSKEEKKEEEREQFVYVQQAFLHDISNVGKLISVFTTLLQRFASQFSYLFFELHAQVLRSFDALYTHERLHARMKEMMSENRDMLGSFPFPTSTNSLFDASIRELSKLLEFMDQVDDFQSFLSDHSIYFPSKAFFREHQDEESKGKENEEQAFKTFLLESLVGKFEGTVRFAFEWFQRLQQARASSSTPSSSSSSRPPRVPGKNPNQTRLRLILQNNLNKLDTKLTTHDSSFLNAYEETVRQRVIQTMQDILASL
jgi:hypothetical protein